MNAVYGHINIEITFYFGFVDSVDAADAADAHTVTVELDADAATEIYSEFGGEAVVYMADDAAGVLDMCEGATAARIAC